MTSTWTAASLRQAVPAGFFHRFAKRGKLDRAKVPCARFQRMGRPAKDLYGHRTSAARLHLIDKQRGFIQKTLYEFGERVRIPADEIKKFVQCILRNRHEPAPILSCGARMVRPFQGGD